MRQYSNLTYVAIYLQSILSANTKFLKILQNSLIPPPIIEGSSSYESSDGERKDVVETNGSDEVSSYTNT